MRKPGYPLKNELFRLDHRLNKLEKAIEMDLVWIFKRVIEMHSNDIGITEELAKTREEEILSFQERIESLRMGYKNLARMSNDANRQDKAQQFVEELTRTLDEFETQVKNGEIRYANELRQIEKFLLRKLNEERKNNPDYIGINFKHY